MINKIYYLLLGVVWGGSFVAIKILVAEVNSTLAALLRLIFSVVILYLFYVVSRQSIKISLKHIWRPLVAGVIGTGLPWFFLFWGQKHISAGLGGIMNGTVPIWAFLFSIFFLKKYEKSSKKSFFGVITSFIGIVIVFYPRVTISGDPNELHGLLALTGMAICYASNLIISKRILSKHEKIVSFNANIFFQLFAGMVFMLILYLFVTPNIGEQVASLKTAKNSVWLAVF